MKLVNNITITNNLEENLQINIVDNNCKINYEDLK